MCQKENRHSLGSLNLSRCANDKQENIYEKSVRGAREAKEAKEGTIRKSVAQIVEKLKIHEAKKNGPA